MAKKVAPSKTPVAAKAKAIKKTPSKAAAAKPAKKSAAPLKNSYMKQIRMFKSVPDYFQMNDKYANK